MSLSPAHPRVVRTAAALIIGGEILSGKIRDENLYALSQTLRALGIELRRVVLCPDEKATIAADVRALRSEHDVLFTSGGVGPTHDDVTMAGVAEALEVDLVQSSGLESVIRKIYKDQTTENHLLMARIPEGAELAETDEVRWPTVVADNVWILPGVPQLFRMKLDTIRQHLRGPEPFFTEVIYCSREEADIKDSLDQIVSRFPQVELGSYPKWFDARYKTKLTLDARVEKDALSAADALRALLGNSVTCVD